MTKEQIHAEILNIQNDFGISNSKMGELMGLTGPTYAKCKSEREARNSFNSGNLEALKKSLKSKVEKLEMSG